MRPSLRLPLLSLLLLLLPSCITVQTDSKLYELRGQVINVATSDPVPGALVEIPGQPARFSDSDGTFAFSELPADRVFVSARKPGFFDQRQLGGWVV